MRYNMRMSVSSIFDLNNYFFNVYAIPNFAIAVILLALGSFVWSRDFSAKLNVSFFLFTISAVGWFFSYGVVYLSNNPDTAFFWNKIVYLFVPFLAPSIFFYTSVLIGREKIYKRAIIISYATMAVFPVLAFFHSEFLKGIKSHWWGYYAYYGWVGYIFIAAFVSFSLLMYFILLPAYSKLETRLKKKQVLFLMISLAFAYTALADFIPKFGYSVYPFGYVSFFIYTLINSYAILRYKAFFLSPQIASREIINAMSDSLILVNKERKVEYANPAALEMFGYSEREIIGKPMEKLVASAKVYTPEGWGRLLAEGALTDPTAKFLAKDKTEIPVKQSLAAIKDPAGEFLGIVCLASDMSETYDLISKLTRKTEELEKNKASLEAKEKELQGKLLALEHFRKLVSGDTGGKK